MVGDVVSVEVTLLDHGNVKHLYAGNEVTWTGNDILFQGTTHALMVALVDLGADFGLADGAEMGVVRIDAYSPVSMVGALTPPTVVPVPAAVWLFGSGNSKSTWFSLST